MKERPILFNGAMVRAVLAGTKTQTRRVVKPGFGQDWLSPATLGRSLRARPVILDGEQWAQFAHPLSGQTVDEILHDEWSPLACIRCPYGQPGDRLWVREAWAKTTVFPDTMMTVYREGDNRTDYGGPWKPGIHMFRRDSRLTLEVTGVRVERLQDISEADAQAEGVDYDPGEGGTYWVPGLGCGSDSAAGSYRRLWESINGPGSWDANPWLWAVEFKRVEQGGQS